MASFRSFGGDVYWHNAHLAPVQAQALIEEFRDEADAAWRAGDFAGHERAAGLLTELSNACRQANRWARAGSHTFTGKAA